MTSVPEVESRFSVNRKSLRVLVWMYSVTVRYRPSRIAVTMGVIMIEYALVYRLKTTEFDNATGGKFGGV